MIASSLRAAIQARGIAQAQIARELNVSPAWVSLRLSGKVGSIADLEAIATVVGLAPTWAPAESAECWHDDRILNTPIAVDYR